VKIGTSWSATSEVVPKSLCQLLVCKTQPTSQALCGNHITVSAAGGTCYCPAKVEGNCKANADGSVSIPGLLGNNGLTVECASHDPNGKTNCPDCTGPPEPALTCTETLTVVPVPPWISCSAQSSYSRGSVAVQCDPSTYSKLVASSLDPCTLTKPLVAGVCPPGAVGCVSNADGTVAISNVLANSGMTIAFTAYSTIDSLTSSCSSPFSVVDTVPPSVTCHVTAAVAPAGSTPIVVSAMASDKCQGAFRAACACPVGCQQCTVNADGSVSVGTVATNNGVVITCSAIDSSGNSATCHQTLRITAL